MVIEQLYTSCLAQGAYYIESNGEAAIIDPLRDVAAYIELAEERKAKIVYILETHFHADFVSGHLDLARQTGAKIIYGPTAKAGFEIEVAEDGQAFALGDKIITVMHTPGHTPESSCFLLSDENKVPLALFTGDTLFLGDVGRPDLAQKIANLNEKELAAVLYKSIYDKILSLPDSVLIYPGHGAGSACGKNMMKETVDTLGNQRKVNYALKNLTQEQFVEAVTEGLTTPPGYFPFNVGMNKQGYESMEVVMKRGLHPLSVEEFSKQIEDKNVWILDTRSAGDFAKGYVPGSVNIGLKGDFAPWVGVIIEKVTDEIVLVCEPGTETEVITRLSRIGMDKVKGYLQGGFESWKQAGKIVETVNRISAEEYLEKYEDLPVVDVRRTSEFMADHLPGAKNLIVDYYKNWISKEQLEQPFVLHCAGGYRSMIAASLLKRQGISQFYEVEGGITAIQKQKQTI